MKCGAFVVFICKVDALMWSHGDGRLPCHFPGVCAFFPKLLSAPHTVMLAAGWINVDVLGAWLYTMMVTKPK